MSEKASNTTNKEADKLRGLAESGTLLYDAADAMCWPFQRVQYWEKRLNIRFKRGVRRTITQREEAKFRRLAAQGITLSRAALEMHWGTQKVQYYEREFGVVFRRVKPRPIVKGKMRWSAMRRAQATQ